MSENDQARAQLLDPSSIRPSRWANRHESTFQSVEFVKLKEEIAAAGGNVQPINVRQDVTGGGYEVVFGHRRLRACQELGLPVLAIVVSIDDRSLWEEMERENRSRANLSPYEQGRHYKAALDQGLYPSIRRLAEVINVDVSQASKVIRIADLPDVVINAFSSPRDIQVNWAAKLGMALDRDRDGVLKRAAKLVESRGPRPKPNEILKALVDPGGVEPFHAEVRKVVGPDGSRRATIRKTPDGYSIAVDSQRVSIEALHVAVQRLLDVGSHDVAASTERGHALRASTAITSFTNSEPGLH
jgi:ParB family chromosome partitioning protein